MGPLAHLSFPGVEEGVSRALVHHCAGPEQHKDICC